METYKQTFTVLGAHGAMDKTFKFEGPGATKDRHWVDFTIKSKGGDFIGTLSKAQARAIADELSMYFGFHPDFPAPRKAPNGPQAYRGNGKHTWEKVAGDQYRLRVPGGWLYAECAEARDADFSPLGRLDVVSQTTFVPVPTVVGYKI